MRTAKAQTANIRRGQDTKARALIAAGWVCLPPDDDRMIAVVDDDRLLCADDACTGDLPAQPYTIVSLHQAVAGMLKHLDAEHGLVDPLTDQPTGKAG